MKKSLLLLTAVALASTSILGQLSTRQNNDGDFRLGTRPQAGDAALHFVIPINELLDSDNDPGFGAGELLTFKYYKTKNLAYRAAFRFTADNSRSSGTAADSSDSNVIFEDFELETINTRSIDRTYTLAFGAEQHFTNSNIFDVYTGAEAMIGLGKDKSFNEGTYFNGDIDNTTFTTNTTVFGFEGVVGFNVFVAELPIAVGLEYGWGGRWIFNGKTKVERTLEIDAADVDYTAEWEQQESDAFGNPDSRQYSDLSRREFNMDTSNSLRLNILIYFSTDKDTPDPIGS